jgi:hypothetical protein
MDRTVVQQHAMLECCVHAQVELLETVTSALVCLLQAQPSLADQVPSLGHIPQLCKKMVTHRQQGTVIRATVLVLHQLATSEVCALDMWIVGAKVPEVPGSISIATTFSEK